MKYIIWALLLVLIFFAGNNYISILSVITDPDYSNLSLIIVTLVAGVVALVIYFKQKSDFKKDAANIIYLELINAERILKKAKEDLEKGILASTVLQSLAFPTESWSRYKYLFVRDFDSVQWDAISDFYEKGQLFDNSVNQNNSYFQKNEEQIRINLQRVLAELVKENKLDFNKISKDEREVKKWRIFIDQTENFAKKYMSIMTNSLSFAYSPQKPLTDVTLYLNNLNLDLSQSSVAIKLKKLARIKD